VVVEGAHHPHPEMEPSTMAALAILAGIGAFCWLLYGAAIYALPFLVGVFVGLRAEQAGAGSLGGIVLGLGAGLLVLVVGRTVFAQARGRVPRIAIASVFAAPAALAGYSATSMLFGLASASEGWRQAFAIVGAMATGAIAWQRLAATLPPASDDIRRRPAQAWGQGAQHRALDPRRRPLRRSV
jgi:MFS family permease